ncbi:hypothetical protein B296_00002616, partial [Ensete ventricosum]
MNSTPFTRTPSFKPRFGAEGARRSNGNKQASQVAVRPRPIALAMASDHGGGGAAADGGINNAPGLGLRASLEETTADVACKDSQSLPRGNIEFNISDGMHCAYRSVPVLYQYRDNLGTPAVERWLVDRAVLPIENSLGGSIHRNYDLLLRHNLHIVGEVKYAVRHCLLANPGVKKEDLKRVLSHPQVQLASPLFWYFFHQNCLAVRFLMLAREPIIPVIDRPFK